MTMIMTNTHKDKETRSFKKNVLMYTGLNTCVDVSAHDTHLPHEDKEKDIKDNKDKDKDRMLKMPNICYIFGRLGFNDL